MSSYKIVAAIWEDHTTFQGMALPDNLETAIRPSMTIGILYKETDRHIVLVSHIERYESNDACDYTIILKSALIGPLKEYGTVEIKKLRKQGG